MINHATSPYAPPKADVDSGATPVAALTLATARSRLAAKAIDALVMLPTALGGIAFVTLAYGPAGEAPQTLGKGPISLLAASLVYFLAAAIYQMAKLSTRGQTVGKRAMKIRVVKRDGAQPGFVHAVLLRELVNVLPSAIPFIGRAYAIVDFLFVFRADRRCLHDLIAGTRVVRADV